MEAGALPASQTFRSSHSRTLTIKRIIGLNSLSIIVPLAPILYVKAKRSVSRAGALARHPGCVAAAATHQKVAVSDEPCDRRLGKVIGRYGRIRGECTGADWEHAAGPAQSHPPWAWQAAGEGSSCSLGAASRTGPRYGSSRMRAPAVSSRRGSRWWR